MNNELTMEKNETMCGIINKLFELNFDEILQKIFLNLDPLSLKNSKCVCSEWRQFITERLWNSKPARKQLQKRLINQWKFHDPFVTEYDFGMMGVSSLACDDDLIVCGYLKGQAKVFDLATGELRFEVQCNTQPTDSYDDGVQLDLGKNVIGAITEMGTVSIWNREDGTLLYQELHHGEQTSVMSIKVTDDYVLTGAVDGSVIILENVEGQWKVTHKMCENKEVVIHIDVDGKWAVTGTGNSIKLWDLEEHKLVENVKPVQVQVQFSSGSAWMLSFIYPHAFAVGGSDFDGVQIWDMVKCVKIRHILEDNQPLHNIHSNGRFLTLSEYDEHWADPPDERTATVAVFDVLELVDIKVETKNLWKRKFDYNIYLYNAVSNTTSLFVAHNKKISILNFWKDQICP